MRILLTGGSGLIGRSLIPRLLQLAHQVTLLTRDPVRSHPLFADQVAYWQTLTDRTSLDGFDAVINLAGEPIVGKRWTAAQKVRLCQSRWQTTEQLVGLINNPSSVTPPSILISGSAVGFYGNQGQLLLTEEDSPHAGFTQQLCAQWEAIAMKAQSPQTRVCLLRTGVVLAAKGGALAKMLPLFRWGLGGPIGNGQQYMSWIHIEDMVNGTLYLLDNPTLQGPFNLTAPYPVHNEHFSALLGKVLRRPVMMRTPAGLLRLLMGEMADLLLSGQRVIPQRLEEAGFTFRFNDLEEALRDLLIHPSSPANG